MPESPVPEHVRQFLVRNVRSVAQLEILLLLHASPERCWTAADVYKTVLSNENLVIKTLETFCQLKLVRKSDSGTYQFAPADDETKATVRTLSELYRERPNRVIQAIYEPTLSEIEEFARAFRLRKDS